MGDNMEINPFCDIQPYQTEGINNWSLSNKIVTVTPSRSEMPSQIRGQKGRILTPEEAEKLMKDQTLVSDFKQQKLERDAQKNWDLFYKRNSTNFFKDRHWTTREFEELKACREFENQKLIVLEAGCGVGNCLFPLLEDDLNVFIYACDFSPRAIEFVKQNHLYNAERCKAFQCDLTKDNLLENVPADSVDVVTLIFVLSAIHPDKMLLALENIYKILKPGGSVLFRDYGQYDHTMLRFKNGHKLGPNFYVRQDGTRSFFFSDEYMAQLLAAAEYEVLVNEYVFRETVNKKEGLCVPRVFLQCKFKKPERNRYN
ncbi:tRNA N(3)-methylcytidine methyltransferase METTL6 isoform X1 [Stegostoma tigrinum]|uniref:tRNA N(3)-methylcytidine methyltransferase METTL6 isoform X1 n=1 Tax=Stegostoma tigrinum TaxID=3053191 RepID=UPI00202ACFD7|nr:tRNA N(3)-methylcytidine methyltransferase METTL6 isoform X1 [Stegostoma tigrinum]XP_048413691.1 tRNA N(3)-methylcytidine methyltransferase METTL6 isoform X1 [Stegostoma tigrinum]XP_048413697.1 tRNA N(3)-methylcytidine methyltransferase METTL6 isoform X1 [Stegostoma tigrinum]XP_048413703.1 tRNA N(3)-methylcytidine methyltransferase METTL6 isoform X1 [Stegostoma tigrinum]XP_048413710.1 tRNA N(3)-methylcytidine methyltransferase METTL6 isoform X1 [Stegostoma tigrinum]XP_048413718.1 tRNA N(3)-